LFNSVPNQPPIGTTNRPVMYEAVNPVYSTVIANDDTAEYAVIQCYDSPSAISSEKNQEDEDRYMTINNAVTTVISNDKDID